VARNRGSVSALIGAQAVDAEVDKRQGWGESLIAAHEGKNGKGSTLVSAQRDRAETTHARVL
jgi:hypothetical protein